MNAAITIRNVTKRFRDVVAVDRLDLTVPVGLALWVHRAQRVGQDDDPADDHAHPAARRGRDRGAGRARHARRARLRQLSSRRARALQADVGAPAVALLRGAQRGGSARAGSVDRSVARAARPLGLDRSQDRQPVERDGSEGPVHRGGPEQAAALDPGRAVFGSRPRQCRSAQRRRPRPQEIGDDDRLFHARHAGRRAALRPHFHDLQGQESARRHAG